MALELTQAVCCIKKKSAPCTCPSERALEFTCVTMKVTYAVLMQCVHKWMCAKRIPLCDWRQNL